jgi:hypothetical protein
VRGAWLGLALCLATAAHAGGPAVDVDLAAMLPRGDEAVEYWDLVGDFDSGHRLYARFLITNVGPGDRTALAFGHWVTPDGRATAFKNGKREGNWTLAPDRKRLKIGSSVLSLGTATRHFEVDNDKRGIKIFVDIEADGTALAATDVRAGDALELLNLGSATRGSYWLEGMAAPLPLAGRALLTHTVATADEGEALTRRIDFAVLRGAERWFLSTPSAAVGRRHVRSPPARAPDGPPCQCREFGLKSPRIPAPMPNIRFLRTCSSRETPREASPSGRSSCKSIPSMPYRPY